MILLSIMNKLFITISVIISVISVVIATSELFNSEMGFAPEFLELKTFNRDYPNIKEIGFVSDNPTPEYFFYKLQNTIFPIFVFHNAALDYIVCFEENNSGFCNKYFVENNYKSAVKYSENLYLLKKTGEKND